MAEDFIKDIKSIKELIKAVAEAKVDFTWEQVAGYKITINGSEKRTAVASMQPVQVPVNNMQIPSLPPVDVIPVTSQFMEAPQSVSQAQAAAESEQSLADDESLKTVTSPLVGTFYSAASPEDEPFVKVGDKVVKGQKLGIIEAMKLMNDIESDFDGEIAEILVSNESMVEYGQPLFKIK